MFGARWPMARAYADLLVGPGITRGLVGPREVPRLWERHLLNCALVSEVIPEGARVCDVGSGAGLPGLVLAIRRPDLRVTLVEPLLRRTVFLEEVVEELGLDGVDVVRARAEALHGERSFDVVTSRAVAPMPQLAAWCVPLVSPGGAMVAMKGQSASDEVAAAAATLADLGVPKPEIIHIGHQGLSFHSTVVRARVERSAQLGWHPRRDGRGTGRSRRQGRPS